MEKNVVYSTIAHDALLAWGMADSDEKAWEIVENSTFDELENMVGASSSIHSAVVAIDAYCMEGEDKQRLSNVEAYLLGSKVDREAASAYASELAKVDKNDLALYCLGVVHDGWVVGNVSKFNKAGREQKKYQHLPLEMIGWKEAKADLLFLKPILKNLGVDVDEVALHDAYNKKVAEFFAEHGFVTKGGQLDKKAMATEIERGKDFYPALTEGNTAKDKEEAELVANQSAEKVKDCLPKFKNA